MQSWSTTLPYQFTRSLPFPTFYDLGMYLPSSKIINNSFTLLPCPVEMYASVTTYGMPIIFLSSIVVSDKNVGFS